MRLVERQGLAAVVELVELLGSRTWLTDCCHQWLNIPEEVGERG
jgi:hypothetical protein